MGTPRISKMHKKVMQKVSESNDLQEFTKVLDSTKELQKNTFWDDAYESYIHLRSGYANVLMHTAENVKRFIDDPNTSKDSETCAKLTMLFNQLNVDNTRFFSSIDTVFQAHKDKRGSVVGAEEHTLLLRVNLDYAQANDIYIQAVQPIVDEINDLIGLRAKVAEQLAALQQQQEQENLINPNIVSDAVVKTADAEESAKHE